VVVDVDGDDDVVELFQNKLENALGKDFSSWVTLRAGLFVG